MNVQEKLAEVFREVFKDKALEIKPETTANDVDGWDSFAHVTLILAIETRFNIKFALKELMSFKKVGDMIKCIESKLTA